MALLMGILLCGCAQETEWEEFEPQLADDGSLRGVSLSPRSFEGDDFSEFMERVSHTQDVLMWAGDWIELSLNGAPATVSELSGEYDYIPLIEVGHYTQSTGELFRPLNAENRQLYLDSTLDFIVEYHPEYFSMGVEINVFAEKNPEAFEKFILFYNELYDRIKAVSPDTKVFTVFQLEKMKGLTMWEIEESEPHWEMINRFKSDLVAFTTYPGLFYRDVSDIPDDHYLEIMEHTSKPIAFTEIGWHSAPSPAGWESSQRDQAEFISRFFELVQTVDPEIVIWSFMYDPDTFEPFNTMGLIDQDGNEKLSWKVWVR